MSKTSNSVSDWQWEQQQQKEEAKAHRKNWHTAKIPCKSARIGLVCVSTAYSPSSRPYTLPFCARIGQVPPQGEQRRVVAPSSILHLTPVSTPAPIPAPIPIPILIDSDKFVLSAPQSRRVYYINLCACVRARPLPLPLAHAPAPFAIYEKFDTNEFSHFAFALYASVSASTHQRATLYLRHVYL